MQVPKPIVYAVIVVIFLALIPPALIARARSTTSEKPRIHLVQDMDNQHRLKAQQASPQFGDIDLFRDGRAMRPPIAGAVSSVIQGGGQEEDDHYEKGLNGQAWATSFPPQVNVDLALLQRGQERFNIYCSVCHGLAGYGDGIVHQRAMELLSTPSISNGTVWVAPKSLHEEQIVAQPLGQIFNTISNGVRNMSGYAAQIPIEDRWAIVAYVKALERAQNAKPKDVPDVQALPEVEIILPGDS